MVLSQYLTAIQCAGSLPPQETGLTCNSWYGKYHLEMHWWHAAHFPMWNRAALLERSLGWYSAILPSAREKAKQQGYTGARWPKMTAPDGRSSPSPVGEMLIWQQPHPIAMAELCYAAHPDRATLERYRDVVMESAEFMASFAYYEAVARPLCAGAAGDPGAGESSAARDLESDVRAGVLVRRAGHRASNGVSGWGLAPNPKWEEVRVEDLGAAGERRRLSGARKLSADFHRAQSRSSVDARRAGRVARRKGGSRDHARNAEARLPRLEMGGHLGLGFSHGRDDCGGAGREGPGGGRACSPSRPRIPGCRTATTGSAPTCRCICPVMALC